MTRSLIGFTLTLSFLLASTGAAVANVKTEQKSQVKFEGMLGRMMGMFGGDAAKDGIVTTTIVVGDRMLTRTDDRKWKIVDLAEGRTYDVDVRDRTYEITTFEELRAQMEALRERARQQTPPDAPARQDAPDGQPAKEFEIDLDVRRTEERRTINNYDTAQVITTITVREKGRTLEEAGGIVMTVVAWVVDALPGMQEVLDFQRRYAEALGEILGLDSSGEQMASALAMFPGLAEAMKRFQEEGVEMAGTAILSETTFENVRGQAQLSQAEPPEEEEPRRRGRFGGLGGIGSRIGRAMGGGGDNASAEPRSTIFTAISELLGIDPNVAADSVMIPDGFTEK